MTADFSRCGGEHDGGQGLGLTLYTSSRILPG